MYHHRGAVEGYSAYSQVYLPQNPAISMQLQHHSAHDMYHHRDAFKNAYLWRHLPQNPAISTQLQSTHSHVRMDTPLDTTTLAQPAPSASSTSLLASSQNECAHFRQGKPYGQPYEKTQARPRVKQRVHYLVNAVKGDVILCRWKGCHEIVEATARAIHTHATAHSKREKTCQWSPAERREICNFSGEISGRHFATHLHHEGQPSPWVTECQCGYKYVATGSGNGHQPGCPFKKTNIIRKQHREEQKTVMREKRDFSCVQTQL